MIRIATGPLERSSLYSRVSAFVVTLTALAGAGAAQSLPRIEVQVSGTPVPEAVAAVASGNEVEGDLNCFEVLFAESGLRAIVQDYPALGPEYNAQMRTLAKYLFRETVLTPDTLAAAQRASGVLYGIEYDWFYTMPIEPAVFLPDPMQVKLGIEEPYAQFATVYSYDADGYAIRKAFVEGMIGHAMPTFVIFESDVLSLELGGSAVEITGKRNEIYGPIWAGDGLEATGNKNVLHDCLMTLGEVDSEQGNELGVVEYVASSWTSSLPSMDALKAQALAEGRYFEGEVDLGGLNLQPGLVFAEESISVDTSMSLGAWKFVSATGDISFQANGLELAALDGVTLAIAYEGDITVSCKSSELTGALQAPGGMLDLTGSGNTLHGTFSGTGVQISGSGNLVTDGTETLP